MAEICSRILGSKILNVLDGGITDPFKVIFTDLYKPVENRYVKINSYEIPLVDYVSICNTALQKVHNNSGDHTMNYLECVFNMHDMNRGACTGKINLDYNLYEKYGVTTENIFVHIGGKKIEIKFVEQNKNRGMIDIATEFLERLKYSTCKYGNLSFNSLAISSTFIITGKDDNTKISAGHANILLLLKNENTQVINFLLYDPQGYDIPDDEITLKIINEHNVQFITELAEYMTMLSDYKIEITEPATVQCNIGIQQYIRDYRGFCMLISSLWMFVILGLIKNSEEDDIEDIFRQLPLVERCLYANLEEEQINTILVNFSIHILIYYLPLIIGKEKTEKFNNYCIQEYIDIYKLQDDSAIQKSKRKRRIESRLALMEETDLSAEEKNKRDDCDTCERHGECKSNNCVRGTCRPDGYRKGRGGPQRKNGSTCKYSRECCSETCRDGICVKNIDPYKAIVRYR